MAAAVVASHPLEATRLVESAWATRILTSCCHLVSEVRILGCREAVEGVACRRLGVQGAQEGLAVVDLDSVGVGRQWVAEGSAACTCECSKAKVEVLTVVASRSQSH